MVLAIDSSISMRARDYEPSRFEVARSALRRFVEVRLSTCPMDKVGIVAFYEFALPIVEPSVDMKKLVSCSTKLKVLGEATNLGDAILAASSMLDLASPKTPSFKRRIVVITDGTFNQGPDPAMAALYASTKDIAIDFVTMGRVEQADSQVIDECVRQTKGTHLHAADAQQAFAWVMKLADRRSVSA